MADVKNNERQASIAGALFRGDTMQVRPLGGGRRAWLDGYYQLMQLSWPRLSAAFMASFLLFNAFFAWLYWLDPAGLATPGNPDAIPRYWRDFFFSVHTVATIGYGNVYPVSAYANVIVVIEITLGILFFALTTGIVFARFSRPTARILFSHVAVVRRIEGRSILMLRAANQRHNLIYSASVRLAVLEDSELGGVKMRRFRDLVPMRDSNPAFALTWTIMHEINEQSPIHDWAEQGEAPVDAELVVILSGFDGSSGQTIYGRWAYRASEIVWDARFTDIVGTDPDGVRTIDYARFHDVHSEDDS